MGALIHLECIQSGGGAYLVDQGRSGLQHLGISPSGAADNRAAQRALELLQLPNNSCLLELTLSGGQWMLSGKGQFVMTGADMNWRINGRPVEMYTTIDFDGDYILTSGVAIKGCRSYLAFNGEWQATSFLGSVSPGLPEVSAISAGWLGTITPAKEVDYTSDLDVNQHYPADLTTVKVQAGPEWSMLDITEQTHLLDSTFTVGQESDRQGLRLDWPSDQQTNLKLPTMISSPVIPGTVQLTNAGPILLMKDAQSIGGFPRILVTSIESLDPLAQLKPGDAVKFTF